MHCMSRLAAWAAAWYPVLLLRCKSRFACIKPCRETSEAPDRLRRHCGRWPRQSRGTVSGLQLLWQQQRRAQPARALLHRQVFRYRLSPCRQHSMSPSFLQQADGLVIKFELQRLAGAAHALMYVTFDAKPSLAVLCEMTMCPRQRISMPFGRLWSPYPMPCVYTRCRVASSRAQALKATPHEAARNFAHASHLARAASAGTSNLMRSGTGSGAAAPAQPRQRPPRTTRTAR